MISLRTYQSTVIDKVRQSLVANKRVCLQVPTGGGKTIIACYIMQNAVAKGKKVLFLVHLKELIEQTSAKLKAFGGINHGIIAAGFPANEADIQLAMVQTLNRRESDFVPDLIVIDEAHHATAGQYQKILERYPQAFVLGLTATPIRLDGKGLKDIFNAIVTGPTVKSLIEEGHLNRYRYYSVPKMLDVSGIKTKMGDFDQEQLQKAIEQAGIVGDAVGHYKQHLNGKKAIVFCQRIKHSEELVELFTVEGISAAHLDGKTPKSERESVIERFRTGDIKVLCNCSLISEGFDVPDCDGVIMLRPTKSLSLYLQMIGRGLRPSENPTIVLDHVGNYTRHGLPCEVRKWSLKGKTKIEKEVSIRTCKQCFAVYTGKECPECGAELETETKAKKETKVLNFNLIEITVDGEEFKIQKTKNGTVPKPFLDKLTAKCRSLKELQALGRKLGYKSGWAYRIIEERNEKESNVFYPSYL
jgi:superfamily II DNA or RNA helicase